MALAGAHSEPAWVRRVSKSGAIGEGRSWSACSVALGLRAGVLPEARVPLSFLGRRDLALQDMSSVWPLTLSLSPPLPNRGSPPSGPHPSRCRPSWRWDNGLPGPVASTACVSVSPFGRSCVAGPARPPRPGPVRSGFPASLTTVLAAKANISAARPWTHGPLRPRAGQSPCRHPCWWIPARVFWPRSPSHRRGPVRVAPRPPTGPGGWRAGGARRTLWEGPPGQLLAPAASRVRWAGPQWRRGRGHSTGRCPGCS